MEKKLNCFLMLSLREMALRRIAVVLMHEPDFWSTIEEHSFEIVSFRQNRWVKTLERKMVDKVSKLPLPTSLGKEMIPILKAIGSEILRWILCHKHLLAEIDIRALNRWRLFQPPGKENFCREMDARVFEKLCWTAAGTIDYQKTSEILVFSDVVNSEQRFKLACLYCMEDCIPELWNEMPVSFFEKRRFTSRIGEPNLRRFLPYILHDNSWSNSLLSVKTVVEDCLKYSALLGNKATTEYCLSSLTEEQREAALFETAVDVIEKRDLYLPALFDTTQIKLPEVLCYLLSLMGKKDQLRIFREYPSQVLSCFFDWPWHDLCLEIAEIVWNFIPEDEYEWLLHTLKVHIRRSGFYIPKFFQEFFLLSPLKFRKSLLDDEFEYPFFLEKFLLDGDSCSIRFIFGNMAAVDKERLLFCGEFLNLLDSFILRNQWNIVEECILQAELSKEDRNNLKEALAEHVTVNDCGTDPDATKKRKRFFKFLDGRKGYTAEKRSLEDETLTPVKKFCLEVEKKVL